MADPGQPRRHLTPGLFHDGRRLRIGLFGGSFNPAHEGHLHLSDSAARQLGLDEVWWLVSPQNPLKQRDGMAPLRTRLYRARHLAAARRKIRVIAPESRVRVGAHLADGSDASPPLPAAPVLLADGGRQPGRLFCLAAA